MNLGYCVVFDYMEQGWDGLTVIVTGESLERCVSLVENISNYPRDHQRYTQQVFDLTRMYHRKALDELDPKLLSSLQSYSPESIRAINDNYPVAFTVQAHTPLGTRTWINRKWDQITDKLTEILRDASKARSERRK